MSQPLHLRLTKHGFTVQQFDHYHFRVNGSVDYWYNEHNRSCAWHDLISGERGKKPFEQLFHFISTRIQNRIMKPADKDEFVGNLRQIGWSQIDAEKEWSARQCPANQPRA